MNEYLIKYKIATVAELIEPFEYGGYSFESYTKEWWDCDAWVATKTIEAEHAGIARAQFHKELIPLIECFSVVSQCAFRIIANTYIIYKTTNNPDKTIYIYYVRDVGHVGLHFDEQEIAQLDKFKKIQNREGLMYISEAANASTFYTRLAMLLAGAEGLAGEVVTKKETKTNQNELKDILGDALHDKLYGYGKGLRHKLFHGNIQSHQLFDGLTETVYDKLRDYLERKYDIKLEREVVHPQRNFNGNYESASTFEKLKDDKDIDIGLIESAFDDKNDKHHEIHRQLFDGVVLSPKDY